MISEKIELLGKGLYSNIPDTLTLHSIPTASELDYVGAEDFDITMIEKILPEAVEEKIDFYDLLEIDYYWLCRCLRIINYGPYFTTNRIYCPKCGAVSEGEYQVNLNTIDCKPLPADFKKDIVISRDEFIDLKGDVHLHLLTIRDYLNYNKDTAFQNPNGTPQRGLARLCYMISSFKGDTGLSPIDIKLKVQNGMSPADYKILDERVKQESDYGLRASGITQCPKCHSMDALYLALLNDKFFRPTLGNLRQWKTDKGAGKVEDRARSKAATI